MLLSGVRAPFHELAENRPLLVLSLLGVAVATAAAASPLNAPAARAAVATAVEEVVADVAPPPAEPQRLELVWEGKDIDGDGIGDFANPTGHEARGHDAYGEGEFGARRD